MEADEKYFSCIASDNVREFVATLNEKHITKDDIVYIGFNQVRGNYYAIIYR